MDLDQMCSDALRRLHRGIETHALRERVTITGMFALRRLKSRMLPSMPWAADLVPDDSIALVQQRTTRFLPEVVRIVPPMTKCPKCGRDFSGAKPYEMFACEAAASGEECPAASKVR